MANGLAARCWFVGVLTASHAACTLFISTDGLDHSNDPPVAATGPSDGQPANVTDAGPDAASFLGGGSRCGLSSFLVCDGFELDSGLWAPRSPRPTTTRAARGARSHHITLPVGDGGRMTDVLVMTPQLRFPQTGVFVRAFAYVPSGQPLPDTGLLWIYEGKEPWAGVDIGFTGSNLRMRAVAGPAGTKTSATLVPLDRWFCLELEVFPVGTQQSGARAWLDERAIEDLTITNGVITAAPDTLEIGLEVQVSVAGAPFDMWLDEIAADFERVGCAR